MKILYLYTINHTGTEYVREFIAKHPRLKTYYSMPDIYFTHGGAIRPHLENEYTDTDKTLDAINEIKQSLHFSTEGINFIQHHVKPEDFHTINPTVESVIMRHFFENSKVIFTIRDILATAISWYDRDLKNEAHNLPALFHAYLTKRIAYNYFYFRIDNQSKHELERLCAYCEIERPEYASEYEKTIVNASADSELKQAYRKKDIDFLRDNMTEFFSTFDPVKDEIKYLFQKHGYNNLIW